MTKYLPMEINYSLSFLGGSQQWGLSLSPTNEIIFKQYQEQISHEIKGSILIWPHKSLNIGLYFEYSKWALCDMKESHLDWVWGTRAFPQSNWRHLCYRSNHLCCRDRLHRLFGWFQHPLQPKMKEMVRDQQDRHLCIPVKSAVGATSLFNIC